MEVWGEGTPDEGKFEKLTNSSHVSVWVCINAQSSYPGFPGLLVLSLQFLLAGCTVCGIMSCHLSSGDKCDKGRAYMDT